MSGAPYDKYRYAPVAPYAFEQVTADSTGGGVALTASKAQGAKRAVVIVETAQIRYIADGVTTITTSVGMLANPGDQLILWGPEIQLFKAIRTGATSATLDVEYSR